MARARFSQYVGQSLAQSTQKAYAADLKRFLKWGGQIPAPARLVAKYLAAHATALKISTLQRHVASIIRAHTVRGLPSPCSTRLVKSTLKGIRRVHGSSVKQAMPLDPKTLRLVTKPSAAFSKLCNLRDRALLLTGFWGGFRRSELVGLVMGDLTFTKLGVVVRLRTSKTDSARKGRDVAIPFGQGTQCPVRALQIWIKVSQAIDAATPLFKRIDKYGHLHDRALCSASVGWILRQRMAAAGLSTKGFSAHSLRAGFVTTAAKAGIPTWSIQRQTGHRSEQMVHRYIRGLGLFEHNAAASIWSKQ
jgi:integrase